MTAKNENKIKKLLDYHRPGMVFLASWLESQGISRDLQKHYLRNEWLKKLGAGAYIRPTDEVTWESALASIIAQKNFPVHIGALTALIKQGSGHYIRFNSNPVHLFTNKKLPKWFTTHKWEDRILTFNTGFLPVNKGIKDFNEQSLKLIISEQERAILECLYIAPIKLDLVECYLIMEGLNNLRPNRLQYLLENCKSIKVKRLFLYMAGKANHQWLQFINTNNLYLGSGDRKLVNDGVYINRYGITVPSELEQYAKK